MLTDHLLTPHDDLQKIPLGNIEFSWFTDGSYVKGDNGKYCAVYAIITSFDVVEAESLPVVTSAQQAKLYVLTSSCTLAEGKTACMYTDNTYAFRVVHNFGML